ncbi:MAG TPA: hypothetical protein VLN49_19305 [Gemmatimonadaceae bacterium]|nr:hypothetical protein [Gemmatimonadaceae bacterium]
MLKIRWILAAVAAPGVLVAQDTSAVRSVIAASSGPQLPVRTYTLRRLSTTQAARLITPYVQGPMSGVFSGASSHELTVRASQSTLRVVDSLLRERDKASAPVRLNFQLIAATDSAGDDLPGDIGAALRSMFRFKGYRLISQGSVATNEDTEFSVTLGTNQASHGPAVYRVHGTVESVAGNGMGSLPLTIQLSQQSPPSAGAIFSTGLTVPLGQTVVLGSGAVEVDERPRPGTGPSVSTQALILAVRPDVVGGKRE